LNAERQLAFGLKRLLYTVISVYITSFADELMLLPRFVGWLVCLSVCLSAELILKVVDEFS